MKFENNNNYVDLKVWRSPSKIKLNDEKKKIMKYSVFEELNIPYIFSIY